MNRSINLVFIHGWGMNQGIWTPFIESIADDLPSHASYLSIDLPGYGTEISKASQPYTLANISENLASKLPANSLLVAWSMGGLVAQYLANTKSDKVLGHIQMCSSPKFQAQSNWPGIKAEVLALFASQLIKDHKGLLKRFIAIQCMGQPEPRAMAKRMFASINQFPLSTKQVLKDGLRILADTDLRGQADRASLPCLRIFGALDSLIPRSAIENIQGLFPDDEFHCIAKASHAPFVSHSTECKTTIIDFIHRHFT